MRGWMDFAVSAATAYRGTSPRGGQSASTLAAAHRDLISRGPMMGSIGGAGKLGQLGGLLGGLLTKKNAKEIAKYLGPVLGLEAVESFVPFGVGGDIQEALGGTGLKKYKRINPLNPKALRRALRRVEGFQKFARRSGLFARTSRITKKSRFGRKSR